MKQHGMTQTRKASVIAALHTYAPWELPLHSSQIFFLHIVALFYFGVEIKSTAGVQRQYHDSARQSIKSVCS